METVYPWFGLLFLCRKLGKWVTFVRYYILRQSMKWELKIHRQFTLKIGDLVKVEFLNKVDQNNNQFYNIIHWWFLLIIVDFFWRTDQSTITRVNCIILWAREGATAIRPLSLIGSTTLWKPHFIWSRKFGREGKVSIPLAIPPLPQFRRPWSWSIQDRLSHNSQHLFYTLHFKEGHPFEIATMAYFMNRAALYGISNRINGLYSGFSSFI